MKKKDINIAVLFATAIVIISIFIAVVITMRVIEPKEIDKPTTNMVEFGDCNEDKLAGFAINNYNNLIKLLEDEDYETAIYLAETATNNFLILRNCNNITKVYYDNVIPDIHWFLVQNMNDCINLFGGYATKPCINDIIRDIKAIQRDFWYRSNKAYKPNNFTERDNPCYSGIFGFRHCATTDMCFAVDEEVCK